MPNVAQQIIDLLAVPAVGAATSWDAVERAVGLPIPSDYRTLIDHTGAIIIDDWLCLYGADVNNSNTNIAELIDERERAWESLRKSGVELHESYFSSNARLLAFAAIEATYFYWHAIPGIPPEGWTVVVVDDDLEEWYDLEHTATECILGVISGSIALPPFDDLFGGGVHRAVPMPSAS